MSSFDTSDRAARLEAHYSRMCVCGHRFGTHTLFSGCILCDCGCANDTLRTVEYTDLTSVSGPPTVGGERG